MHGGRRLRVDGARRAGEAPSGQRRRSSRRAAARLPLHLVGSGAGCGSRARPAAPVTSEGHPAALRRTSRDDHRRGCQTQSRKADDVERRVPPWRAAPRACASTEAAASPACESEKVTKTLMEYMVDQRGRRCRRCRAASTRLARAHEQHAVLRREPVGERREAVRQPAVDRHVGHHARPVDEAGLRGDEQQRRLGDQRRAPRSQRPTGTPPMLQAPAKALEQHGVHRLALDRRHAEEQVGEQDAAGGDGERDGHVDHRPLAGLPPAARA